MAEPKKVIVLDDEGDDDIQVFSEVHGPQRAYGMSQTSGS